MDPEDFFDADDDEKPMYPDTNQLLSDDVEYLDMVEELNDCMDDVVDEVVSYSKVCNDSNPSSSNESVSGFPNPENFILTLALRLYPCFRW